MTPMECDGSNPLSVHKIQWSTASKQVIYAEEKYVEEENIWQLANVGQVRNIMKAKSYHTGTRNLSLLLWDIELVCIWS